MSSKPPGLDLTPTLCPYVGKPESEEIRVIDGAGFRVGGWGCGDPVIVGY